LLVVLARDISDSVRVGGSKTVAAAFALDPATGLIRGSSVAADSASALRDTLAGIGAAPAARGRHPRILCSAELVQAVRECLPAVWRNVEVVAGEPGAAAEDLFDSLVGPLTGRQQPSDLPSPADWSMLFRQAQAFVEVAPWQRLSSDVHLHMNLRVGRQLTRRLGIVLGNAGVTYGFALYPGGAKPPGRPTFTSAAAPPVGTLVMTLDPAAALPSYLVAKGQRYRWPDALSLMPLFFAWGAAGAADLSSEQVAFLTVGLAAALAGEVQRSTAQSSGDMILSGGRAGQYQVEVELHAHGPVS
jgi:hypothetical protein